MALRATGSRPRPWLILVAYAVAGIVGMIPATPGGLGLLEASLTGLLVLAQVVPEPPVTSASQRGAGLS
jgi:uncharacterized membrane protein YbhN (UPF0104 family)